MIKISEREFRKHDKEHPNYYLIPPGKKIEDPIYRSVCIEVDPYNTKTVKDFLDLQTEEEQDNRIRHLIEFVNREYDELAVDRIIDILVREFKKKRPSLRKINTKIREKLFPREKGDKDDRFYLSEDIGVIKIDSYYENVEKYHKIQPFFYDKSKLFWFWNKKSHSWEIVDETDLMNSLDKNLGLLGQTVTTGLKSNYIEAFRRVGRNKHPKDAPKKWIQFKNKAFSLKSGKVYKITHDYFFCNPIPWELGKSDKTPIMDKLFEEWVGKDYVPTLKEIIAYCCYANYPIQTLFCLYGSGRNGKTCFLRLLTKFMGGRNICSTDLDLLVGNRSNRFETFKLYKKLVCLMGETNFGILNSSAILKKLTGGDIIGFEKKGKDPFDEYSYAKVLIASNSLPSSEDTSEGFYRRWLIVEFNNKFKEGKDILETIPQKEYNNLARNVCNILPQLLEKGEFTNQGTIKDRKQKYIMASNPLPFFIENVCVEDPQGFIRYSSFYMVYSKFLARNNRRVVSRKEFSKLLNMEGYENRKTSKDGVIDYYVEGIRLKESLPDFLDFHKNRVSPISNKTEVEKPDIREIKEMEKAQDVVIEQVK